jgi:hypothetical protein
VASGSVRRQGNRTNAGQSTERARAVSINEQLVEAEGDERITGEQEIQRYQPESMSPQQTASIWHLGAGARERTVKERYEFAPLRACGQRTPAGDSSPCLSLDPCALTTTRHCSGRASTKGNLARLIDASEDARLALVDKGDASFTPTPRWKRLCLSPAACLVRKYAHVHARSPENTRRRRGG